MGNFVIHDNPEFTEQIRMFETTDPGHATLFNAIVLALLGNDVHLRQKAEYQLQVLQQHMEDTGNPHGVDVVQLHLDKVDNTSDIDKPVSTAQQAALDALYEQLTAYTRQKIADLINGAPATFDTLKEVADAIAAHKSIMDALDAAIGKKASAEEFDSHVKNTVAHITSAERNAWNGKADGNHTHNYSASGHTHDDRYYTESEINTKLSGKADTGHTHNYAASSHGHDDRYYTESEINTKLSGKADTGHTHDDRYYTESEINTKLSGKADSSHTHNYAASSHSHSAATQSAAGFLSAADKTKLDNLKNVVSESMASVAFIQTLGDPKIYLIGFANNGIISVECKNQYGALYWTDYTLNFPDELKNIHIDYIACTTANTEGSLFVNVVNINADKTKMTVRLFNAVGGRVSVHFNFIALGHKE